MGKTILIVEDDQDTRAIYRDALEAHGYGVITAEQGAEGVAMARRHRPDLILLDIRMPIMDGRQAMRYLKSDRHTSHIPIFGISAYATPRDVSPGAGRLEFDAFLVKPVDLEDVVSAIERRIGPPSRGRGGSGQGG